MGRFYRSNRRRNVGFRGEHDVPAFSLGFEYKSSRTNYGDASAVLSVSTKSAFDWTNGCGDPLRRRIQLWSWYRGRQRPEVSGYIDTESSGGKRLQVVRRGRGACRIHGVLECLLFLDGFEESREASVIWVIGNGAKTRLERRVQRHSQHLILGGIRLREHLTGI